MDRKPIKNNLDSLLIVGNTLYVFIDNAMLAAGQHKMMNY